MPRPARRALLVASVVLSLTALAAPAGAARPHPVPRPSGYVPPLAEAPTDHPSYYPLACQVPQRASHTHPCTFGVATHPRLTVAMVGDSVAAEWLAAVDIIAKQRGWRIVTDFHSRCPWTAAMTVNIGSSAPYVSCHVWGRAVLHDLITHIHPDVVITSDRPVLGTPTFRQPGRAAFAAIGRGMATYWRVLLAHHILVVPIRESPEMGIVVPQCLAVHPPGACSRPARLAVTPNPPTVAAARELGRTVRLVDLNRLICPHGTCQPTAGRIVVYRDVHHLTATYVASIAPQVQRALLATGAFHETVVAFPGPVRVI